MNQVPQLTPDELVVFANELRQFIQRRTCCVKHACSVLNTVLASFVLDGHNDDPIAAARVIEREAKKLARCVRRGDMAMRRGTH